MDWVTTSTILDRLRRFDDRAMWDQFIARFRTPIISFAIKCGLAPSEAEDVAQDTLIAFMEAFRSGRYNPASGRLSSWLFGIAYRQAANARRAHGRAAGRAPPVDNQTQFWDRVPEEHEASQAWDIEWERSTLAQCLEKIKEEVNPATFRAFEMVVREGRTPEDAAHETGMTRDAVYVAKHRVLKRLAELVKDYEHLDLP